jgi:hypothetical protein
MEGNRNGNGSGSRKNGSSIQEFSNPFLALQNELEALADDLEKDPELQLHSKDSRYKQIKIYAEQCLEFVNIAFKNSAKYGISGKSINRC